MAALIEISGRRQQPYRELGKDDHKAQYRYMEINADYPIIAKGNRIEGIEALT